jgi:hypothetical protein
MSLWVHIPIPPKALIPFENGEKVRLRREFMIAVCALSASKNPESHFAFFVINCATAADKFSAVLSAKSKKNQWKTTDPKSQPP